MKLRQLILLFTIAIVFTSCNQNDKKEEKAESNQPQQTIYHGGDIITMEGEAPQYVEALVEQDGKIVFIGDLSSAKKKYPNSTKKDLHGKTMFPGFIDGHGHLVQTAIMSMIANIMPAPDGEVKNFDDIVNTMNAWKETENGKKYIAQTGWIMGNGYDDSQLEEKDHPTADILDKISTEVPVMIIHQSGHLTTINHKAMEVLGLTKDSENPEGGNRRRLPNGELSGVLEENASIAAEMQALGKLTPDFISDAVIDVQAKYAGNGYTTCQDGRSSIVEIGALTSTANAGKLYLDIVAYPDIVMNKESDYAPYIYENHSYKNHFRVGGVKLTLDGSPQGKTAWLTRHYHVPPTGENHDYKGHAIMSDEDAIKHVSRAYEKHWQILCHTNGDAAIDQFLMAIDSANASYKYDDPRSVVIHGQTMRKDQIQKTADQGTYVSFYPAHTFYWGDWHLESVLGHPRADYISPCRDAIDAGINITSHHDAPVIPPSAMRVLDAPINRVTRSGYVLGPDQRISVYEGLQALTTWAANQYFEENNKGTLSIGKIADLVILDRNPLKVDPLTIHSIKILETIKEGKTIYTKTK